MIAHQMDLFTDQEMAIARAEPKVRPEEAADEDLLTYQSPARIGYSRSLAESFSILIASSRPGR